MKNDFIDNLKMDTNQNQAFNFGFVNLDLKDVLILMNITENDFNEKYRYYYDIGNSFCKFETLKKIFDKSSSSLESLKEYEEYRRTGNNLVNSKITPTVPSINTLDLIRQLSESKE